MTTAELIVMLLLCLALGTGGGIAVVAFDPHNPDPMRWLHIIHAALIFAALVTLACFVAVTP